MHPLVNPVLCTKPDRASFAQGAVHQVAKLGGYRSPADRQAGETAGEPCRSRRFPEQPAMVSAVPLAIPMSNWHCRHPLQSTWFTPARCYCCRSASAGLLTHSSVELSVSLGDRYRSLASKKTHKTVGTQN